MASRFDKKTEYKNYVEILSQPLFDSQIIKENSPINHIFFNEKKYDYFDLYAISASTINWVLPTDISTINKIMVEFYIEKKKYFKIPFIGINDRCYILTVKDDPIRIPENTDFKIIISSDSKLKGAAEIIIFLHCHIYLPSDKGV